MKWQAAASDFSVIAKLLNLSNYLLVPNLARLAPYVHFT